MSVLLLLSSGCGWHGELTVMERSVRIEEACKEREARESEAGEETERAMSALRGQSGILP